MQAARHFATPHCAATELVVVPALGQQDVARAKLETLSLVGINFNGLDRAEIKVSVLNVRNAQIRS